MNRLILQWGILVEARNDNMQRFMESVALHIGMPFTSVPALMPPPPPPPTYVAVPSPNHSPENAGTFGSSIREETPEEIISRTAYGRLSAHANATSGGSNGVPVNATNININGGPVNATISSGGNYSPPQDDGFPFL